MLLPQQNPNIKDITYLVDGTTDGSVSRANGGAFNFGYIPSGGTSKTLIVYLGVSGVVKIKNIKIFLKSAGSIDFEDAVFWVDSLDYVNPDFIPTKYFMGINETSNPNSIYSISIDNNNSLSSKYVYLNMSLMMDKSLFKTAITYGWTFEYELNKNLGVK